MNAIIFLPVIEGNDMEYDVLIAAAKDYLKLPDLSRGNIVVNDTTPATYSTVYDPAAHSLKVSKSYIKQIPGSVYGYYEVPTTDIIFDLKAINQLTGYKIVSTNGVSQHDDDLRSSSQPSGTLNDHQNANDDTLAKLAHTAESLIRAEIEVNELKAKLSNPKYDLTDDEIKKINLYRGSKKNTVPIHAVTLSLRRSSDVDVVGSKIDN